MELEQIRGLDDSGNELVVFVKKPGVKEYREAQVVYNKAFREALEGGAILKVKLNDFVRSQGLWDDAKEKQYTSSIEKIREMEETLAKGGITLSRAKEVALQLRDTRSELQALIAQRNTYDSTSAEGLADAARFNKLTILCVLKSDKVSPVWPTLDDYDKDAIKPWAVEAVNKLANLLYGLDPDYEKNLPENKFLVRYKFANEKLDFINKEGHAVDSEGRLIDEEGYFIRYDEDGKAVRITRDGKELDENGDVKVEFQPFLDDDGKPVD